MAKHFLYHGSHILVAVGDEDNRDTVFNRSIDDKQAVLLGSIEDQVLDPAAQLLLLGTLRA